MQRCAKRVRVESAVIGQASSSSSAAAPALPSPAVQHGEASEQPSALPVAVIGSMLVERVAAMFSLDASGLVASGMSKIAKEATVGLVVIAFSAVNTLCNQHGKALSKAYGNFDRVVGLGWLVADALSRCPTLT